MPLPALGRKRPSCLAAIAGRTRSTLDLAAPHEGVLVYSEEGRTMNRFRHGARISLAVLAATVPLVLSPVSGHAQTQGMDRRQDRRQNRDDARATRQAGRHAARDSKQECKDAGGNRIDCRQQKRETKQDARATARDQKYGATDQPKQ